MKHKTLAERLDEVYKNIHIETEYKPVEIGYYSGGISDNYEKPDTNVIGQDYGIFRGITCCDPY